ncbi:MAG: PAQR family membrane homeostasis protein TrhA [Acidobacteriaceae bacterium]
MQTRPRMGDILANSITHGIGIALALAGAIYIIYASMRGGALEIVACSIYGSTLVALYLCSTLYHSFTLTRARRVFHILDHSSIYLLIAGTYTPFTLVSLRGPVGWSLFGLIWSLAIAGVVFKCFATGRFPVASTVIYLFMGWVVVFAMRPLLHAISWHGMLWIGLGGLAYTGGVLFYALDRVPYFHALWHLCVLAGSAAHYYAILFYVLPPR